MRFEPIAITGRACLLPGALDVESFSENLFAGRDDLTDAPARRWRLADEHALGPDGKDRAWSSRGGYVTGFEPHFDPTRFDLDRELLAGLDPLFRWSMHCAHRAMLDAQVAPSPKVSVILGNLSFPSEAMTQLGERIWLEQNANALPAGWEQLVERPHSLNRFMSGLPAHLISKSLHLGRAFSLDAACATSLYALQLAATQLWKREADVVLAGAVNRADSLFLHVGFCALQAMSPTGRSRPFHRDADGLVPAEGAAFVALERLSDALAREQPILGIIRGIGLSNDGRGRGFLAPSHDGQVRAIQAAYAGCDVDPNDVSYVECHATGTSLGDATELQSLRSVFQDSLAVGSHKSNFGHAITVAGLAGLLKVLASFERNEIPPTLHVDDPIDAPGLRCVTQSEAFEDRFAGVNAFGFGGNNAHVLLERPEFGSSYGPRPLAEPRDEIAVVAVEMDAGALRGADAVFEAWLRGDHAGSKSFSDIELDLDGLRFPPRDLEQTLGQQLAILDVARRVTSDLEFDAERTSVLVGMGCDTEIVRYGGRWRLAEWGPELGWTDAEIDEAKAAFIGRLEAQGVVGSMPNIIANRINSQLDARGPSFSVSSEQASGSRALGIARDLLRQRLADTVVVGAVELADELVHRVAHEDGVGEARPMGDAAVVLVLERLEDARARGREILAIVGEDVPVDAASLDSDSLVGVFGDTHAASSLLATALATKAAYHAVMPGPRGPAPWIEDHDGAERVMLVRTEALGGQRVDVTVRGVGAPRPMRHRQVPRLFAVHAGSEDALLTALRERNFVETPSDSHRLVFVADDVSLSVRIEEAAAMIRTGRTFGSGMHYRVHPLNGELGFVFTGSATPYAGVAAELSAAVPSLRARLTQRLGDDVRTASQAAWLYGADDAPGDVPTNQIRAASWISLLHTALSRDVLGLNPDAAIGYSLGESNALHALGAWDDLGPMAKELRDSQLFSEALSGDFTAVRRAWAKSGHVEAATAQGDVWKNWTIIGNVERTRSIVEAEPLCHVTIVNTDEECSIGGSAEACERVLERLLDDPNTHAVALDYDVAIHAPEVAEAAEAYRAFHHRPTSDVPGVRFYANATNEPCALNSEAVADALLAQAVNGIDFRRTILNAWKSGVRVFIEHGPRALCTGWIRTILGDREHLAVSLDRPGTPDILNVLDVCAQLVAAGVDVDWKAFVDLLEEAPVLERKRPLSLPAHKPPVELRAADDIYVMPRAPQSLPALTQRVRGDTNSVRFVTNGATSARVAPQAPQPTEIVARTQQTTVPPHAPSPHDPTVPYELDPGALHAAFLRNQAAVHKQFIAHYQSSVQMLIEAGAAANWQHGPAPVAPMVRSTEPPPRVVEPIVAESPSGKVVFSREDLEYLAHGEISRLFGPEFRAQDQYALQVRMPRPPLLLCDRVTELDAEPASMKPGSIVTETDVTEESWYLHHGRMPAGIMIESGQADLLLVSYLGVDLLNKGTRAYRLLGCQLTYKGPLPQPGETLRYDIHIDGFAKHGDVRLFFFHYDCTVNGEVRLQVRNGQAGFFAYDELDESGGILWSPEEGDHDENAPVAKPVASTERTSFGPEELRAFAEGRPWECFGEAWAITRTHLRTPTISSEKMLFLDCVTEFDITGGPWGKGYLRAETAVRGDEWFFDGHFHNDPCMPGTLMFEGALQTMAFYLAAHGYTIDRDGWRFQPATDAEYEMRCRGQVDRDSKQLTYEIFVEELDDGGNDGIPRLFADMLVTVDGLKAFWCRRMGLELVPDYPMRRLARPPLNEQDRPLADEARVRATQLGWPSDAFGPMYEDFDGPRTAPRLPGPPYDTVSRIVSASGRASMTPGAEVIAEYDIASDAWYLAENRGEMPYAILLEVGLQPCGWLASWVGCTLQPDDVFFRNLDGTATQHRAIREADRTLTTRATLTSLSRSGPMTIVGFDVQTRSGDELVFEASTTFGFFPAAALAAQAGISDREPPALPECASSQQLDRSGLLGLLDRVIFRSSDRLVAEMDVDAADWFFKAHFFGDPVQPGSLGLQLIIDAFEMLGIAFDRSKPHVWKYRGQVRPWNRVVTVDVGSTDGRPCAHLWVDGACIYRLEQS